MDGTFRPHNPSYSARMFLGCLSELFELQADDASSEEVNGYVGALIDAAVDGLSIHTHEQASPSKRGKS
jgi:hypothetical protein